MLIGAVCVRSRINKFERGLSLFNSESRFENYKYVWHNIFIMHGRPCKYSILTSLHTTVKSEVVTKLLRLVLLNKPPLN